MYRYTWIYATATFIIYQKANKQNTKQPFFSFNHFDFEENANQIGKSKTVSSTANLHLCFLENKVNYKICKQVNFSYRNRKTPELSISSNIDVFKCNQKCDVIVRYGGYKYTLSSYSISHNKLNYQPCYF